MVFYTIEVILFLHLNNPYYRKNMATLAHLSTASGLALGYNPFGIKSSKEYKILLLISCLINQKSF